MIAEFVRRLHPRGFHHAMRRAASMSMLADEERDHGAFVGANGGPIKLRTVYDALVHHGLLVEDRG